MTEIIFFQFVSILTAIVRPLSFFCFVIGQDTPTLLTRFSPIVTPCADLVKVLIVPAGSPTEDGRWQGGQLEYLEK